MVVHTFNTSIEEAKPGGSEFKANLVYTERSCLKQTHKTSWASEMVQRVRQLLAKQDNWSPTPGPMW